MYAGEEQAMVVPPYPVPKEVKESFYEVRRGASTAKGGKETTTKAGKEAESVCPTSVVWRNQYDLQPSPSASVHFRSRTIASNAACSSTYVPNKRPAAEESWRGLQWRHTDVHRYVARRYFGNPPPAEQ
ncbi:hypothetical protein ADEAN_000520400 [Angomonas deanei]|uniref:Uncharacterized protein n=1 Tax=Angomonas deanei TaxID=59799 RepID=A0A7G2CFR6_9TRYP|nr:hypothetical protein ADEAN_000520400 [Angomonas deanei]